MYVCVFFDSLLYCHECINLRVHCNPTWRKKTDVSSPAVVGGLEGGVTQTCSLLCLGCRSGRQKATTGTALSVTYRATSSHVTTASGSITSSVCQRSSNPEMEDPTGNVSSAGCVYSLMAGMSMYVFFFLV